MEGLSAKSVVVSFISQLIVFLYLLDNDTSWMILASSGVGCCIEFWKIGKAMHIEVSELLFSSLSLSHTHTHTFSYRSHQDQVKGLYYMSYSSREFMGYQKNQNKIVIID